MRRPPSFPSTTRRAGLGAALLLLASGCFLVPIPASKDASRPNVTGFEIVGTRAISADELKEHLATQVSGRKYVLWPDPHAFDPDAFSNDKRRIVRYYQARGYYHVHIDSAETVPDGPGRVKVRIALTEGEPVRVAAVDIRGLDGAREARAKLGKLPLAPGDVFTEAEFDQTRSAILAALTSTGWAKAQVTQHAEVDPAQNLAQVTYVATPGERFRFGGVFVAGAVAIPRSRIREEAEPAAPPGKVFDASELAKVQRNVFDMGVFGGVRVAEGPPDTRRGTLPVVVSVREAPFRTIRAGPGLEIQATRWELDALAGWSHRNWLGGLRKLNLDLRAGYAWLPTFFNSTQSGVVGLAAADFVQPSFAAHFVDFNVHTELERGIEDAYSFYAERIRFGIPLRLGRLFQFVPSVNFELYQLSGAVGSAEQTTTASQLTLATCPGGNPSLCLISYLEQRFAIDLRDDPINTTRGAYLGIAVQEGFSIFGNGSSYLRLLPEARGFVPLARGFVLAARARVGLIDALTKGAEVPIVTRFAGGGPNFMRGYYTRQFSPVVPVCPATPVGGLCPESVNYLPVGGNGIIDGSLELRFPMVGQLGGATFIDFGNTRLNASEVLDLTRLQAAVGFGIRYKTIFGPLRIDIAGRLPTPGGGQPGVQVLATQPVAFDPQGNPTRVRLVDTGAVHHDPFVSVHLSIGEAF